MPLFTKEIADSDKNAAIMLAIGGVVAGMLLYGSSKSSSNGGPMSGSDAFQQMKGGQKKTQK
jgi:hypothetical protein